MNGFPPLVFKGPQCCARLTTELAFEPAKAKAVAGEGEGQIGKADSGLAEKRRAEQAARCKELESLFRGEAPHRRNAP